MGSSHPSQNPGVASLIVEIVFDPVGLTGNSLTGGPRTEVRDWLEFLAMLPDDVRTTGISAGWK